MTPPPSHPRGFPTSGFTLLELMVALSIFALIALAAHAMLASVIAARETQARHSGELARLQKALWLIKEDLAQMEPRTLTIPAGDYNASFLRQGASNPLGLPRSNMLQVAYGADRGSLMRYSWPAGQPDALPQKQALIDHVRDFVLRPLNSRMVEVVFSTESFGLIRRVIEAPEP